MIILAAAGLTLFSAYSAYLSPQETLRVLIQGQGSRGSLVSQGSRWHFPMEATETVAVYGPLGVTVVRIGDNRAWVESSPCVSQTCVASGFIFRQGQWAACLPNNVLIIIEGVQSGEVDAISW